MPYAGSFNRGLALFFVSLAFLLPLSPPVHADALQEANQLLKEKKLAPALEKIESFLQSAPKDAKGRFLKGLVLTEMKRFDEAIEVFKALTQDYPELPEPYNNLAVLYAQKQQLDKARAALEQAIRTHPAYATAHENLGDIYAYLASKSYSSALKIDAGNTQAQTKLTMMREILGKASSPAVTASQNTSAAAPLARSGTLDTQQTLQPPPASAARADSSKAAASKDKPAPDQSAPVAPPASAVTLIAPMEETIQQWKSAWSAKRVKDYLSFYAPEFRPPEGMSRAQWEAERTRRIDKPEAISIDIDNLQITQKGDRATARFRQHYRSGKFNARSTKQLELIYRDGRWLILEERIL